MFGHAVCVACGTGFNACTGRRNKRAIIIYVVVSTFVLLCAIVPTLWIMYEVR